VERTPSLTFERERIMQARQREQLSHDFRGEALLAGRTVLVAGGTGNVGRYLVRALLDHGANVIVPSRSPERVAALRDRLGDRGVDRLSSIVWDLRDETTVDRLRDQLPSTARSLHAVVASLGHFVAAPSLLAAPLADLQNALNDYLIAHFLAVRTFLPLIGQGGSYTFINGPLAFDSLFEGTGLVSVATAAQTMLARVVMKETQHMPVRVNEVIVHTLFGSDDKGTAPAAVAREDVARYVVYLASATGSGIDGQIVHLDSREPLQAVGAA
jgi:NAD(P)-dependent dehydrogenase (short-subunit alcohol dehydrogenase family)